jgi:uncharacterized protein (UPF0248 family)
MTPIHELLNRIRWDKEFGQGEFEIGYFDRRENTIQRIAFRRIVFAEGGGRVFRVFDESGERRRVPFHRVREVYRDGELIWKRPVQPQDAETKAPK